jgi:hypothetical protein
MVDNFIVEYIYVRGVLENVNKLISATLERVGLLLVFNVVNIESYVTQATLN